MFVRAVLVLTTLFAMPAIGGYRVTQTLALVRGTHGVEGIALARKGEVDAVVATSRSGSLFLRTRPGTPVESQLDHLG